MHNTVSCPNCGEENAYYNGLNYSCPNCDYEWDNVKKLDLFEEDDYNEYKQAFQFASDQDSLFKLNIGQIYSCRLKDVDDDIESTFIPLAAHAKKNKFFAEFYFKTKINNDKAFELLKLDFDVIDKKRYNERGIWQEVDPWLCASDKDGTILCELGFLCYDIKEI